MDQFKKYVRSLNRQIEDHASKHPVYTIVVSLVTAFLLAASRRPDVLLHPQFWAEDGAIWYSQAYKQGFVHTIFQTYAGYFGIANRFVASVSTLLPLHVVPLLFNALGLLFYILPIAIIISARFRHIIPYRLAAFGISLLYLGTLNNAEIYGNLANLQWPLALAAFLVLLQRPAKHRIWLIADIVILILSGISGPTVIILLPIAFYLWIFRKENHLKYYAGVLSLLALLQVLGIAVFSHFARVGSQPDASFLTLMKILVGQIFVGGVLGEHFVSQLMTHHKLLPAVFVACIALIGYAVVKGPFWLRLYVLFASLMVASALISLRPTKGINVWTALTYPSGGQRYWFIPITAWISVLIWFAFMSHQKFLIATSSVVLAALVFFGLPTNWRIHPLPDLHFQYYAKKFEQEPRGMPFEFPINPGWTVQLIKK
jgi:hypothetical protein